jgi:hypothetical protein
MAEISKEEIAVCGDNLRVDDGLYLEENPQKALEKLLRLHECQFNERLIYVKHLAEFIGMLGDDGVKNLGTILEIVVRYAQ